jgi:hypothetical protein
MHLFAISKFSRAPAIAPTDKGRNGFEYVGPIVVPICMGLGEGKSPADNCVSVRVTNTQFEYKFKDMTCLVTHADWFAQFVCAAALLFPQSDLGTVRPWLSVLWAMVAGQDDAEFARPVEPMHRACTAAVAEWGAAVRTPAGATAKANADQTVAGYARAAGNDLALRITTAEVPPPGSAHPWRAQWADRLRNFPPDLSAALELHAVFAEAGMTWEKIADGAQTFNSAEWRRRRSTPRKDN